MFLTEVNAVPEYKLTPNLHDLLDLTNEVPDVMPQTTREKNTPSKFIQYFPVNRDLYYSPQMKKKLLSEEENEKRIKCLLYNSVQKDNRLSQKPQFHGQEAKLQYFSSFRSLSRLNRDQNLPKVHADYLKEIKRLNIYPEPIGIVRRKGCQFSINLNNYKIGDKFGQAFSTTLPNIRILDTIQLKQNRLSDKIASQIVRNLSKNIKEIDLSYNQLKNETIKYLCELVVDYQLVLLHIEGCQIGDVRIRPLLQALLNNKTITSLNFAKNNLTYKSAQLLGDIVRYSLSLKKFDLHYNYIGGNGAVQFLTGLNENQGIEELDLS